MGTIARAVLGVIYPGMCIIAGGGIYLASYSDLPDRITIAFDIHRVAIVSLPTPVFTVLLSVLLGFSVSLCVYSALKKAPLDQVKYERLAGHGGFFSATFACLMGGAMVIHKGLINWQDATGPGWWLLVVALIGFIAAMGARLLAKIIYASVSDT